MGDKRINVSRHILNVELVKNMLEALKDFAPNNKLSSPRPGIYCINTIKKNGFSFRVYSDKGNSNSVAIVSIRNDEGNFRVQSAEKYKDYLKHLPPEQVEKWINFVEKDLAELITKIRYNQPKFIPFEKFDKNFAKFIDAIKGLI